ncbi:type VI secretion system baseplate subunit TssG [Paracoccus kondratievae]|uniref:Type VI secretion protein n=1 Tax=Paracoccus kondratievae TaxID=135740 RepID=A0AAD3RV36_9RHOB|nr:type VI secretion system baseplate subunit TssG [Paracoccus kondratievae]QFQ88745.1 type VI secretion system baseplate subunit TssG [Paracoccus kondratievae]GLK65507.1 type VI secretion protein [Paracoccus kondratievae]
MTRPAGEAGFLALLRRLEREGAGRPRIGRSTRRAQDIVDIGQDPRLAFPSQELSALDTEGTRARIRAQFMGFFGPHGALPLNLTEEVLRWQEEGEEGFVAFADILSSRFYQLFFRAWSDAHAISQHDRPDQDRFQFYVGAVAGIGTPAFRDHDSFPDIARLPLVSIFGGRVRSAVRLRQLLHSHFGYPVDVQEHVVSWLEFEPDDLHGLGQGGMLGSDSYLGARRQSVNEKICIRLDLPDPQTYRDFLPGQPRHDRLAGLVYWYLGKTLDIDLALALPADRVPPAQLGRDAAIGWLAAIRPEGLPPGSDYTEVARFALGRDTGQNSAKGPR